MILNSDYLLKTNSELAAYASNYADDNAAFVADFIDAFVVLSNGGRYDGDYTACEPVADMGADSADITDGEEAPVTSGLSGDFKIGLALGSVAGIALLLYCVLINRTELAYKFGRRRDVALTQLP